MKVFSILSFLSILCISTAAKAQFSSPKLSGSEIYNDLSFKNPMKPLMIADSISYSAIQSRLNLNPTTRKTSIVPSSEVNPNNPEFLPAQSKRHIQYRDLNGTEFLKPKSSFGLMQY